MTVMVTAWAVKNEADRFARVDVDGGGNLTVTWVCGDSRRFSPEDVSAILRNLEFLDDGVWYEDRDMSGNTFALLFRDGRLYADNHSRNGDPASESVHYVPWDELREALDAARGVELADAPPLEPNGGTPG